MLKSIWIYLLFYFMFIAIMSAFLLIILKNPIHAIFSLLISIISSVCVLLLIKVEFLAYIFLIVYIGAIAILFFGYFVIKKIKILSKKRLKANDVNYLGKMKVRTVDVSNRQSPFLNVQCKGLIPILSRTDIGFTVSIFTKNDNGEADTVLSMIDTFQESASRAFHDLTRIGKVDEHHGFEDWTTVCNIPIHMLQPAIGGRQKLKIIIMVVDMKKLPKFLFGPGEKGMLVFNKDYSYDFSIKGYNEEGNHINKARALSIKIGVAVAMSDGEFDQREREALNIWINKMVMPFNQEKQLALKKLYNNAKK